MNEDTTSRAGRREWIGLAVLILPTLLISIDVTVMHLAQPALSADLRPSSAQLLWINDAYGFLIAGFLITMGALGDRFGRRRVLLTGGVAFGLASVLAAYAPSAELLIAARALLGVTGATLMPATLSLIRTMFHDPAQRTVAIGLWLIGFSGGMVIGPLVGGVLLENFWWGSVFLLGVPVMALLAAVGPVLLPESRDPAPGRIDPASVLLSLTGVIATVYGLKEIAAYGPGTVPVLALAGGLVLAVLFVRRQRGAESPLLDLGLFAERRFSVSLGILLLVVLAGPGLGMLNAQYLQLVLGLSPLQAGLWMLPQTVAVIAGFVASPALARRIRPGTVAAVGLAVGSLGVALMTQAGVDSGPVVLVTGHTLFFLGASPLLVLGTDMIIAAAPAERAGSAAALSETAQEFGGALGLAVFGSIAAAVYRAGTDAPAGVPERAAEQARDTLGGAAAVAERLPGDLGAALLGTAREAFVGGLHAAAAVATVLIAAAAVLSAVLLRHVPPISAAPSSEDKEQDRTPEPAG
ncbi:MFS transporter, DHA2 family, multidrug resistance protein [Thermomonospora echinospora]|uniref:MFS transporter, DHA2 family, multidrug resistance protein n=1 Tax=Thermomonospora echinospora TaxID=1992 RepID=A0A1H6D482_9ACTN|nr:MFS transporter [Thermomonospora echinospora]SEG80147.1 MFS transporter, DHA2 family, multidrug resistance protein [Thermomonospora echinospora]